MAAREQPRYRAWRLTCGTLAAATVIACATILGACRPDAPRDAAKRPAQSPANDASTAPNKPNIIFLTVDTLRADHLPIYGYGRETAPSVDALAGRAVIFNNAVVPRGSTRPSYASILTGLYPFHHGVRSNGTVLHDDLDTLAEILKRAGYHTAAFVSNFVLMGEQSGCNQGFDVYDDRLGEREANRNNYERAAPGTLAAVLDWLADDPPHPFFLFTNFIDPHGPYRPPDRLREHFNSKQTRELSEQQIPPYQQTPGTRDYYDFVDRYDAEIRLVDEALGMLITELVVRGLWDNALVVFVADHGESLGEHGIYFEHHMHVYEETVRVPLVIRLPKPSPLHVRLNVQRRDALVSPMDLTPTVLDFLAIKPNRVLDGRSMMPLLRGEDPSPRMMLLEFPSTATSYMSLPDEYAVRSAAHKLIRVFDADTGAIQKESVFDIARDPLEQQLIEFDADNPDHRRLGDALDRFVAEVNSYQLPFTVTEYEMPLSERGRFVRKRNADRKVKTLTEDQIDKLRSLGYVRD